MKLYCYVSSVPCVFLYGNQNEYGSYDSYNGFIVRRIKSVFTATVHELCILHNSVAYTHI
jgi:hypothetical protein